MRPVARVWWAIGLALVVVVAARADVVTWRGGGTPSPNEWRNPSNWSNSREPTAADDVTIPTGAAAEITITSSSGGTPAAVRSLVAGVPLRLINGTSLDVGVGGASFNAGLNLENGVVIGVGAITVAGASTWTSGQFNGTGVVTLAAGSTMTLRTAGTHRTTQTIDVRGTLRLDGNQTPTTLNLAPNGAVSIGKVILRSGSTLLSEGPTGVTNQVLGNTATCELAVEPGGVISKTGAHALTLTGDGVGGVSLVHSGAINVTGGTLTINYPGRSDGSFSLGTGTTLAFSKDHDFLAGAAITGNGVTRLDGTCTLRVLGDATIANPIISGPVTGAGNLAVTGGLGEWRGNTLSTTGGIGAVSLRGGAKLAINTGSHVLQRPIIVESGGELSWTAGQISIGDYGKINVLAGGVFRVSAAAMCIGSSAGTGSARPEITIAGTLARSGAGTTTQFLLSSGSNTLAFNNNGLVQVEQGTLDINLPGVHAGRFDVASGTTLLTGKRHDFISVTQDQMRGGGTWILPAAGDTQTAFAAPVSFGGTIDMRAGSLAFNGIGTHFVATLLHSGGVVTGSANLTLTGAGSRWTAGTFDGLGLLSIAAMGRLEIDAPLGLSLRKPLQNDGTINWIRSNITLAAPSGSTANTLAIDNRSAGVFNMNPGGSLVASGGLRATFTNLQGVVNKSGAGSAFFDRDTNPAGAVAFVNRAPGRLNVNAGALELKGGGSSASVFTIAAGATLRVAKASTAADAIFTFSSGSTVTGDGMLELTDTAIIAADGDTVWNNVDIRAPEIRGNGVVSIAKSGVWRGGTIKGDTLATQIVNLAGSTFTISGNPHTLSNRRSLLNLGTIVWSAGNISCADTDIDNRGTLVVSPLANLEWAGTAANQTLRNSGSLRLLGPANLQLSRGAGAGAVTLDNLGSIEVVAGVLTPAVTITQFSGNTISGGEWVIRDDAYLDLGLFQIKTLGTPSTGPSGTHFRVGRVLNPATNQREEFKPLTYLSILHGTLSLDEGVSLYTRPNGGELINLGRINLASTAVLELKGSYTQTPGATLNTAWAKPVPTSGPEAPSSSGEIKLRGFGIVSLAGILECNVDPNAVLACADRRTVVRGAFMTGGFDSFTPSPAPLRYVLMEPGANRIDIAAYSLADFNRDGFISFDDFDEFVFAIERGEPRSDINADGFIDFTDFDDFVAIFEAGC